MPHTGSKLDEALALVNEWFESRFTEYDEDGKYNTSSSKEWGRYRKIVDNLKAFGASDD
jgi:hypothetical protein